MTTTGFDFFHDPGSRALAAVSCSGKGVPLYRTRGIGAR
jgi:hypothetical protein